jgi:hypothetical protein
MTGNNQHAPTASSNPNLIPAIIIASGLVLGGYFLGARQEMVVTGEGAYASVMILDRFGGLKSCDDSWCYLWVKGKVFVHEDPAVDAAAEARADKFLKDFEAAEAAKAAKAADK